jgi:hypothetical protein
MKRQENIQKLYSLSGKVDGDQMSKFHADFFGVGITTAIDVSGAVTTGFTVSGATTTGVLISGASTTAISITGACTTAISITAVCGSAGIDFGAASVTTGSLIDYTAIVGKVSGYLFNGTMTTSVLTASTLIDDFSCSCAHDGVGADTVRMVRRTWTGALPNGTLAADFIMAEYILSSVIGTDQTKTGTAMGIKVNLAGSTLNDDNLTVHGIYVDVGATDTKSATVNGISINGGITAINIVDASDLTNLFKFNEVAGCVGAADVDPDDAPSAGGLGGDGNLVIDVNGTPFYIALFNSLVS